MTDSDKFGLIVLRGHLKLLAVGLKNSRLSGTEILAKVTAITGTSYKRGQYRRAIAEINELLE